MPTPVDLCEARIRAELAKGHTFMFHHHSDQQLAAARRLEQEGLVARIKHHRNYFIVIPRVVGPKDWERDA